MRSVILTQDLAKEYVEKLTTKIDKLLTITEWLSVGEVAEDPDDAMHRFCCDITVKRSDGKTLGYRVWDDGQVDPLISRNIVL